MATWVVKLFILLGCMVLAMYCTQPPSRNENYSSADTTTGGYHRTWSLNTWKHFFRCRSALQCEPVKLTAPAYSHAPQFSTINVSLGFRPSDEDCSQSKRPIEVPLATLGCDNLGVLPANTYIRSDPRWHLLLYSQIDAYLSSSVRHCLCSLWIPSVVCLSAGRSVQ